MKDIESVQIGYERVRNSFPRDTEEKRTEYDFYRLLDSTWSLKTAMELLSRDKRNLGKMTKHSIFRSVVVCSRCINKNLAAQKVDSQFLDCWISFRDIVEKVFSDGEELSNSSVLDLAHLLFITALIFNMPENANIENIVSNPDARRLSGTFEASMDDIEFGKALPGDLSGPFKTVSDVLINHKKNLHFYLDKIDR